MLRHGRSVTRDGRRRRRLPRAWRSPSGVGACRWHRHAPSPRPRHKHSQHLDEITRLNQACKTPLGEDGAQKRRAFASPRDRVLRDIWKRDNQHQASASTAKIANISDVAAIWRKQPAARIGINSVSTTCRKRKRSHETGRNILAKQWMVYRIVGVRRCERLSAFVGRSPPLGVRLCSASAHMVAHRISASFGVGLLALFIGLA